MVNIQLIEEINKLKKEKNAVILAHYYQRPEVQDIADYVGDSLALSRIAAQTEADIIVFCGVHFMAETAKILSPTKKVLLPVIWAGCSMANMISEDRLAEYKKNHPDTKIICYVNTTASVKALCDVCVTSSNAIDIIKHYAKEGYDILYCPDRNLAKYVTHKYGYKLDVWPGFCCIHNNLMAPMVEKALIRHPNAEFIAHPECRLPVLQKASFVGSTKQLIEYVTASSCNEFIIGTEEGVIHQMKKNCPDKTFHILSDKLICYDMKLTRLEDIYNVLKTEENEIMIPDDILYKAQKSLEKMLELSK